MDKIRVLVVDDQPVVRSGLIMAINQEPDLEVVGEAEYGYEAIEKSQEHIPDLVLMDMELPDMSGIEATRQILASNPRVRVLVFSAYNDEGLVLRAIDAGAMGYILKGSRLEEILESIRKVHSGEEIISSGIANTFVHSALNRSRAGPGPDALLSRRELEVMKLISDGFNLPDIAEKLGLRTSTVRLTTNVLWASSTFTLGTSYSSTQCVTSSSK